MYINEKAVKGLLEDIKEHLVDAYETINNTEDREALILEAKSKMEALLKIIDFE
jgi:flagellin-like hook-associated protein FlgL